MKLPNKFLTNCFVFLTLLLCFLHQPRRCEGLNAAERINRIKSLLLHGHTHEYTVHEHKRLPLTIQKSPTDLRAGAMIDPDEFQHDIDALLADSSEASFVELTASLHAQSRARHKHTHRHSSAAVSNAIASLLSKDPKPPADPKGKAKAPAKGQPNNSPHTPGGMAQGPQGQTNECKIDFVEVTPREPAADPDPGSKYQTPLDIVKHMLYYTGAITDGGKRKDKKTGSQVGRMVRPDRMVWVDTRKYHFECFDGRSDHAILGSAGGDLSEFALALNAFEHTKGLGESMDQKKVDLYFRDFVGEIEGQFYGHTDAIGWFQWSAELKKKINVSNPFKCNTPDKKQVALELAPQFYGCTHIQLMIGKEDQYRTRADLVRQVIRSFFTVLMDEGNILRTKMEFAILTGYPNREYAIVNVMSPGPTADAAGAQTPPKPDPKPASLKKQKNERFAKYNKAHDFRVKKCYYRAPLITPRLDNSPERSLAIFHPRAVYEKRAVYTEYLMRQEKMDDVWKWKLFALMNDIGKAQLEQTKKTLWTDTAKYVAEFFFDK